MIGLWNDIKDRCLLEQIWQFVILWRHFLNIPESFYAFHTFLVAWMDHNGRMWFEREPWGPWDPHSIPYHIIWTAECHTETHIENPTISYPQPHAIPNYFSQAKHSNRITHSFQGNGLRLFPPAHRFDVYKTTPRGVDLCFCCAASSVIFWLMTSRW